MSAGEGVGVALSQGDAEILQRLLDAGAANYSDDVVLAGTAKAVQVLLAQIASAKLDPSAMRLVLESERHPLLVRRFAALDPNGNRQSWTRQEERLLKHYFASQERVKDAKVVAKAAAEQLLEAERAFEKSSLDVALLRITLLLRSMQQYLRPALDAGAMLTLATAVLSRVATADDASSDEARAEAKQTFEALTRRVDDSDFAAQLGELIREFVKSYEQKAGPDGRVSLAAAERIVEEVRADGSMSRMISDVMSGESAMPADSAASERSEEPVSASASSGEEKAEDDDDGLPF